MTGVRYDTAFEATQEATLGVILLANELSGGSSHLEAPGDRSAQASALYDAIHPGHRKSVDDPDTPRLIVKQRAMLSYLSSKTLFKVCNSVLGRMGRLNMALAVRSYTAPGENIRIPSKIIPLAGLFVSCLYFLFI